MKKTIKTLIATLFFSSSLVYASTNFYNHQLSYFNHNIQANDFLSEYNDGLRNLLNEYRRYVSTPIDARALNISDPKIYNFLKKSTRRDYDGYFLAIQYFPTYQVNYQETSFCFILYDERNKNQITSYYSLFKHKNYALSYLITHEFGHCIYRHQKDLRQLPEEFNANENEAFADLFSYAYFISKGYPEISKIIVDFINQPKHDEVHKTSEFYNSFIIKHKEEDLKDKNIMEIFDIIYKFLKEQKILSHSYKEASLHTQ